jgi:hypothetical protein
LEDFATAADWSRPIGNFASWRDWATNVPGPTTESTRGSWAICASSRAIATRTFLEVTGCLSETIRTLYGVAQPGPIAAAIRS